MVSFSCPVCRRRCDATVREDGSASLKHPISTGCKVDAKDLLRAYIASVKPILRHAELEGTKDRFG